MTFTIKDLKNLIKNLPDDMEIIQTMCSDYQSVTPETFSVIKAIKSQMRNWSGKLLEPIQYDYKRAYESHIPTMSEEDRSKIVTCFHIEGN